MDSIARVNPKLGSFWSSSLSYDLICFSLGVEWFKDQEGESIETSKYCYPPQAEWILVKSDFTELFLGVFLCNLDIFLGKDSLFCIYLS